MRGIDREISIKYGLEVKNLTPYKDSFMVTTSLGRKILKRSLFSAERLMFIHGAKEHLAENGFTGVDRYLCTTAGKCSFLYGNSHFTLSESVEGRASNFDNDNDLREAAITLAKMHIASRGYIAPEGSNVRNDLGKMPGYFNKRLNDIKKMRKQAKGGKGRFDRLFLENVGYFCQIGENAITALEKSAYKRLSENALKEGIFCHRDYTHHNIIMSGTETAVINFEHCCHELKIYDIINLIRRKMRKCGWNVEKAILITDSYSSLEPISDEEFELMKIMLQFPQKFWRVSNRYYNSRRSWSEKVFTSRLQEVIDEVEPYNRFAKLYTQKAGG